MENGILEISALSNPVSLVGVFYIGKFGDMQVGYI